MTDHDRAIIQEHADRLHAEATLFTWLALLVGAALGFAGGYAAGPLLNPEVPARALFGLGAGLVGGLIGWQVGTARALSLRLQARTILCLAQIEEKTLLSD